MVEWSEWTAGGGGGTGAGDDYDDVMLAFRFETATSYFRMLWTSVLEPLLDKRSCCR